MLSDIDVCHCECLFVLIDFNILKDEMLDRVMYKLRDDSAEMFEYVMWLLRRWVHIREHKYSLPNNKTKNTYCVECGKMLVIDHKFCYNCGTKRHEEIRLNDYIVDHMSE